MIITKYKRLYLLAFLFTGYINPVISQVNPEIQLGGRGVTSFNTDIAADRTTSAVNDFSDTGILLGFRQKLYNSFRSQFVIGFQFPDADSDLGQLFFHQTFIKVEDKSNIIKMGRSRVRSSLIEFPTLRDDDALYLTDALNPFSAGKNSEDNQYGNVLEYSHIHNKRYWLRIHGEHFTETPIAPVTSETNFSMNAIGLSFEYKVPKSEIWNRPFLQQLGIGLNNFLTNQRRFSPGSEQILKNVVSSAIFNIKRDPVHFWDLRSQIIYGNGIDEIRQVNTFTDFARARSISNFTSLRYLYRKLERPTLQLSISAGYKVLPDLTQSSNQTQLIGNAFYRLGENFDVIMQIQYKHFNGDLKNLFGTSETRIQLGFVYSIDQLWNNQFDDRESILNLEHGYIP